MTGGASGRTKGLRTGPEWCCRCSLNELLLTVKTDGQVVTERRLMVGDRAHSRQLISKNAGPSLRIRHELEGASAYDVGNMTCLAGTSKRVSLICC